MIKMLLATTALIIGLNGANIPQPNIIEVTATGYCPCKICCGKYSNPQNPITASGEQAVEGVTIAADWDVFPVYTRLEIEGIGRRIVHDTGGAIKGHRIDVYFEHHEDAVKFGKQKLKIKVWED